MNKFNLYNDALRSYHGRGSKNEEISFTFIEIDIFIEVSRKSMKTKNLFMQEKDNAKFDVMSLKT